MDKDIIVKAVKTAITNHSKIVAGLTNSEIIIDEDDLGLIADEVVHKLTDKV